MENTTGTGSVSGRFTILQNSIMEDLAYRRNYGSTQKISLLRKKDTVSSIYTSLEKFQFLNVAPGVYRVSVEDSVNKDMISLESPEFEVRANHLTMISSSISRALVNEKANEWLIYRFDTAHAKKKGLLTLQFPKNPLFDVGDTVSLFIGDGRVTEATKPVEISIPASREAQLELAPGFYELVADFYKNDTTYYSRLHLNIPILPEETFAVEIKDFKEVDNNVYLYMTDPVIHYKLYRSLGSVLGRFSVFNAMDSLGGVRTGPTELKISIMKKEDTIRSVYTSDERFQFSDIKPGVYNLAVETADTKEETHWLSPEFEVRPSQVVLASAASGNMFVEEPANQWCFNSIDEDQLSQPGRIRLTIDEHVPLEEGNTVSVSWEDRHQPHGPKSKQFIPKFGTRLTVLPGFYELVVHFNEKETHYYSLLHINIPVLPGEIFDVKIKDFKESDKNVSLFMTNPEYHYKLYKSCVK